MYIPLSSLVLMGLVAWVVMAWQEWKPPPLPPLPPDPDRLARAVEQLLTASYGPPGSTSRRLHDCELARQRAEGFVP